MVLPAYKVISLVIKTLSKPLITYTKQIHLKSGPKHPLMRRTFIRLGNSYHQWIQSINMSIMGLQRKKDYQPINDELAIDKGIQLFYEVIIYLIIISFSIYQVWQSSKESKAKKLQLEQTIKRSQKNLQILLEEIAITQKGLQKIKQIGIGKKIVQEKSNGQKHQQQQHDQSQEDKIDMIIGVLEEVVQQYLDEE